MLHERRTWGVVPCEDAEELAVKLTEQTWTLCTAFRTAGGTVWANDSTSADALQEYAVLRPMDDGSWNQVETITVSWCDVAKLENYIGEADAGKLNEKFGPVDAGRLETDHDRCQLCM